jgi:uncharacterized membrane protein YccC
MPRMAPANRKKLPPSSQAWLRHFAFVLRCSASATLSYVVSVFAGLPHPMWAPMSALIISQDRLHDTRASLSSRILGTLVGITSAVVVDAVGRLCGLSMAGEVFLAVAICACCVRIQPATRVCMWTAPIVLLTPDAGTSISEVALFRGAEVLVGCLVGAALHFAAEQVVDRVSQQPV